MKNLNFIDASVIIPIYNQKESLKITLNFLKLQEYPIGNYEIIIVDDGSTDGLMQSIDESTWPKLECDIKYIRQENQGRSIARNRGVNEARGKRLIFCDADRFPDKNFVKQHVESGFNSDRIATIGCPLDYFGHTKDLLDMTGIDLCKIKKFSRTPLYYKKMLNIFMANGNTQSGIAWASFLVGNSSVEIKDFEKVGGFDTDFKFWGFEHFELALRLQESGVSFQSNSNIFNYHIPHNRSEGFYKTGIQNSIQLLKEKHLRYDFDSFSRFLFGEVSLQDFEFNFCGTLSEQLKNSEPILYLAN